LRGPRPRAGSSGLEHALATFRANRDAMHRSDPRWLIEDDAFDVAAELIARLGAALAPLEGLKKRGIHSLAKLASQNRDAIGELSKDGEGKVAASPAMMVSRWPARSRSLSSVFSRRPCRQQGGLRGAISSTISDRVGAARKSRRARAHLRPARTRCKHRPRRARRPHEALAPETRTTLGCRGRCVAILPRSAGTAHRPRPTTSRKRWAQKKLSSPAPPRSPVRDRHFAFRAAHRCARG